MDGHVQERREGQQDRRTRRRVVVLTVVTVVFWAVAVALPTWVLVVIGDLPGTDPGRTERAITIATGAFIAVALPAVAATAALVLVRRARARVRDV